MGSLNPGGFRIDLLLDGTHIAAVLPLDDIDLVLKRSLRLRQLLNLLFQLAAVGSETLLQTFQGLRNLIDPGIQAGHVFRILCRKFVDPRIHGGNILIVLLLEFLQFGQVFRLLRLQFGQLLLQAGNRIREFFLILLYLLQQFGLIPVMVADRVVQSLLQIRYLILQFPGLGVDFAIQFLTEIVQLAGQFLLKNGGIITGAIPADHQNTLRLGNHVFFAFSIKGDAVSSFLQNKSPIQHTLRLFACVFIFIVVVGFRNSNRLSVRPIQRNDKFDVFSLLIAYGPDGGSMPRAFTGNDKRISRI